MATLEEAIAHASAMIVDMGGLGIRAWVMETRGNTQIIRAQVPMAEMLNYQTDLTWMTQGRASFSMEFAAAKAAKAGVEEEEE
jgi:elongation factor G